MCHITYAENSEVFTLDTEGRTSILEHINKYLQNYHLNGEQIHLVVTEFDGFVRVNGVINYNVIPIFNKVSLFIFYLFFTTLTRNIYRWNDHISIQYLNELQTFNFYIICIEK